MSQADIRSAFAQEITLMPDLQTAWPNRKFNPVANVPYQEVNFIYGEPENTSYGDCHREVGYLQITLRYPAGVGTKDINSRAELIRERFYRGKVLKKNEVTVIIQRTPDISAGYNEDERFVIIVKVRFFANHT